MILTRLLLLLVCQHSIILSGWNLMTGSRRKEDSTFKVKPGNDTRNARWAWTVATITMAMSID